MKRGDPLGFINIHSVAKYQKTRRGDSFKTLKNFRKKNHTVPKKNWKGGPFGLFQFCRLRKKVKNERGDPFALISADRTWPLMLVVLVVSIVRKVAQSEWDCSLTKKKEKKTSHCKSRALFPRKAPTKNHTFDAISNSISGTSRFKDSILGAVTNSRQWVSEKVIPCYSFLIFLL